MARPKKAITPNENGNQTPRRTLTSEEQSIISRVEAQDTDWFAIGEESMHDFSLAEDPLKLPTFAQKLHRERKFAFRWCERKASRADELTRSAQPPLKWAIVNSQTLPESANEVDDILGCVCRLDQMLLFKPWHHFMMVQEAKQNLSAEKNRPPTDGWEAKQHDGLEFGSATSRLDGRNPYKIQGGDDVQKVDGITNMDGELLIDETSDFGDLVTE